MTRKTLTPWIVLLAAALALPALAQSTPRKKDSKGKRRPREIVVVGSKTGAQDDRQVAELLSWARAARTSPAYRARPGGRRVPATPGRVASPGKPSSAVDMFVKIEGIDGEIAEARRLNEEILRAGERTTPAQRAAFERRMRQLVAKMDRRARCGSDVGSEGPARCMCNCDKAYPGWGGGKGWNRFWCKAACIKVKVGKGGASVGD
ncbi:MAG: hypothetical protein D6738_09410 [Acidobacteria bacterium]|nr:MAG: hypothetical protein D6738_09410 [Acidobacteriota bacterium]